jgi:hypothetical protein
MTADELNAQSQRLEEQVRKQYWVDRVQIDVLDLEVGWETIRMTFDDRVIEYCASYVGEEPISTLVDAADALDGCYNGYREEKCFVQWQKEPGFIEITFYRKEDRDYIEMSIESDDPEIDGYSAYFDYSVFKDAVIKASLTVLKKYGIVGYSLGWNKSYHTFPVHQLLALLGIKSSISTESDERYSSVFEELEILKNTLIQAE